MRLTKRAFIAWLREQKPGRRFRRNSGCSCPIAEWLATVPGRLLDNVGVNSVQWCGHKSTVLPKWAERFIKSVDYGNPVAETITAAECLALLGEKP